MNTIKGARFCIFHNKQKLDYNEKDGFIGNSSNFTPNDNIRLVITLPANCTVFQNKAKSQELEKVKAEEDSEGIYYVRVFALLQDEYHGKQGWLYPRMRHNNSNRIKVVMQNDTGFKFYEVGFCHQKEKLFFRIQLIREGKGVFIPNAPKQKPDTSCNPKLPDNVAQVLWYNDLSGVMALRTNMGTARGYWTELVNCETRFAQVTTPYVVYNELAKPTVETDFEVEMIRGIVLTDDIPSIGEIYILVKHAGQTNNVDEGFEVLREMIGF